MVRRSLAEWTARLVEMEDDAPPLGAGSGVSHVRYELAEAGPLFTLRNSMAYLPYPARDRQLAFRAFPPEGAKLLSVYPD